jgi:TPR repeat protein
VAQDYGAAALWYRRAARQGHANAQLNLQAYKRFTLAEAARHRDFVAAA